MQTDINFNVRVSILFSENKNQSNLTIPPTRNDGDTSIGANFIPVGIDQ